MYGELILPRLKEMCLEKNGCFYVFMIILSFSFGKLGSLHLFTCWCSFNS